MTWNGTPQSLLPLEFENMIVLELTEYRNNGEFYPLTLVVFNNIAILEANLETPGPVIVGQPNSIGKGSFIVGAVPGKNLVVKETVAEITKRLKPIVGVAVSGTGL
jgi:hypothetical protein